MAVLRSKPHRGLTDIRTMSDLTTETSNPQRKFLKLAMLAMERIRRGKEKASARHRIEDIDARFAEIEAETKSLMQLVNAEGDTGDGAQSNQPKTGRQTNIRGLKFRY